MQRDFCMRAVLTSAAVRRPRQPSTHAELLIYLVDNIWQHRTGDEPIGKATRTEQMILREFYAYLPEKKLHYAVVRAGNPVYEPGLFKP